MREHCPLFLVHEELSAVITPYNGNTTAPYRDTMGTIPGQYRDNTGTPWGLYRDNTGTPWGLYRDYTGTWPC